MLKKLRRKFVLIAMCSVACVLFGLIGIINVINYRNVIVQADARVAMLQNGGAMPQQDMRDRREGFPDEGFRFRRDALGIEAMFDSRYFVVAFGADGEVTDVNTGRIAAVDTQQAETLATAMYEKGKAAGFSGDYRFVRLEDEAGGVRYFFLDCSRELSTFSSFLAASCLVSAVGLVLVFLPVFFLSKRIMRPVAESYEKQKRFITDASHEIKTPLAVISAANEVVELEYGESEWTKSSASQIDRLSDLTQKLVMLSRMDEEDFRPAAETFSLSDTLTEVAETFIPVAQVRQKKYGIRIAPDISFSGDEQAIRQLANLLLDNAMKYAAGEGNIEVSLKKSGKYKVFSVENDVTDMSDGRHDELFERFYRADASRNSETGGHGIGLSVAKAITESHGGKITAECRGGRLTFTCRF